MDLNTNFQSTVSEVLSYQTDLDKLIRRDLSEPFTFSKQLEIFNNIFGVITPLNDIVLIRNTDRKKIESRLSEILKIFERVISFDFVKQDNIKLVHKDITDTLQRNYDQLLEELVPVFALKSIMNAEAINLSSKKQELEELVNNAKKTGDDIKKILSDSQDVVGKFGVSAYSEIFSQEYTKYEESSRYWLIGTFVVLSILIIVGFVFIFIPDPAIPNSEGTATPLSTYNIIHYAVVRLVILTVLFYALNLCSKNFKSFKHNAILNKHRSSALQTFQIFTDASADASTKDAVLLEATRAIFSSQPTGYSNNENEAESPSRIIEIIKSAKD
ncbi:MAG: hypothetical protein H6575_13775 [Lewinellaceae bacterium]|nr:hypothetical protein [Lewinellaceae bacterium]